MSALSPYEIIEVEQDIIRACWRPGTPERGLMIGTVDGSLQFWNISGSTETLRGIRHGIRRSPVLNESSLMIASPIGIGVVVVTQISEKSTSINLIGSPRSGYDIRKIFDQEIFSDDGPSVLAENIRENVLDIKWGTPGRLSTTYSGEELIVFTERSTLHPVKLSLDVVHQVFGGVRSQSLARDPLKSPKKFTGKPTKSAGRDRSIDDRSQMTSDISSAVRGLRGIAEIIDSSINDGLKGEIIDLEESVACGALSHLEVRRLDKTVRKVIIDMKWSKNLPIIQTNRQIKPDFIASLTIFLPRVVAPGNVPVFHIEANEEAQASTLLKIHYCFQNNDEFQSVLNGTTVTQLLFELNATAKRAIQASRGRSRHTGFLVEIARTFRTLVINANQQRIAFNEESQMIHDDRIEAVTTVDSKPLSERFVLFKYRRTILTIIDIKATMSSYFRR